MAEITLADPKTIDERLSDLADRIWQVRGVIGAARSSAHEMADDEGCSDAENALSLAHQLLDEIAGQVETPTSQPRRHRRCFMAKRKAEQPAPVARSAGDHGSEDIDLINENLRQLVALLDLIQRADGSDLCAQTLSDAAYLGKRLAREADDAADCLWKQLRQLADPTVHP